MIGVSRTYIPRLSRQCVRRRLSVLKLVKLWLVGYAWRRVAAAAMALPLTAKEAKRSQSRLIIFITFCVIFSTLVLQGLTLRPIIKWFGIKVDDKEKRDEDDARLKLAASVIEHIEENYSLSLSDEVLNQIKTKYEIRIQRLRKDASRERLDDQQIMNSNDPAGATGKERKFILELRETSKIRTKR